MDSNPIRDFSRIAGLHGETTVWERDAIEEVDSVVQHLANRAMFAAGIAAVIAASHIFQLLTTAAELSALPSARVLGPALAVCRLAPDTCDLMIPTSPSFVSIDGILSSIPKNSTTSDLIKSWFPYGIKKDTEYLYLGYGVEDEADLAALAAHLVSKMESAQPIEEVIPLPIPRSDGRNVLLPIAMLKDVPAGSAWSSWYQDPSRIPVFVNRDCLEGRGGHVIFLDGSTEYYPYARASVWPLTRHGLGDIRTIANPESDTKQ